MQRWRTVFILAIVFLSVVHAVIFVKSMHISEEINKLEAKTKALHQKNIDLEAEVYKRGSLEEVSSHAAKLGFVKSDTIHALKLSGVARR